VPFTAWWLLPIVLVSPLVGGGSKALIQLILEKQRKTSARRSYRWLSRLIAGKWIASSSCSHRRALQSLHQHRASFLECGCGFSRKGS